jgi:hypothetical protein
MMNLKSEGAPPQREVASSFPASLPIADVGSEPLELEDDELRAPVVNPSAQLIPSPKPASDLENTANVCDMFSATEGLLRRLVINGHVADSLGAKVPEKRGPIRYLRVNGVNDCIAYGLTGQRDDGMNVAYLAHLAAGDYSTCFGKEETPISQDLKKTRERLRGDTNGKAGDRAIHEMAATNFDHAKPIAKAPHAPPIDITKDFRTSLLTAKPHLHVTETAPQPRRTGMDYFLDVTDGRLHLVGDYEAKGEVPIGDAVDEYPLAAKKYGEAHAAHVLARLPRKERRRRQKANSSKQKTCTLL